MAILCVLVLFSAPGSDLTALLDKSTEYNLRKAYWDEHGFYNAKYNISAVKTEPHGNANMEFPWAVPLGTSEGIRKSNFHYFPEEPRYYMDWMPLTVLSTRGMNRDRVLRWEFKEGTVFGEKLYLPSGAMFEVRTRTKKGGEWRPTVYRPSYELPPGGRIVTKELSGNGVRLTGEFYELPRLGAATIKHMLDRPFVATRDPAPTSSTDSVVPAGYLGFAPSVKTCMKCHEDTKKHASDIDIKRDWYGRVRGDDGIFSWYPVTDESIAESGIPRKWKLRD